jgi:mono/diheme cytochrome c family protein
MDKIFRASRAVGALVLIGALAACDFSGGYEKVPSRTRAALAIPAAPDPPPVVAGIGRPAAAEAPVIAEDALPAGVTMEMVTEGERLYGTVCVACHGPGGAGSPAGPGLRDTDWLTIDGSYDSIVNVIHTGVATPAQYPGMMPPLGGGSFTDEQVRAIGAYVYALSQQPGA